MSDYRSRFRTKIFFGFSAILVSGLLIGGSYVQSFRSLEADSASLSLGHSRDLLNAEKIRGAADRASAEFRAYLLTGDVSHLAESHRNWRHFDLLLESLSAEPHDREHRHRLQNVLEANQRHRSLLAAFQRRLNQEGFSEDRLRWYRREILPLREALAESLDALIRFEQLESEKQERLARGSRSKRESLTRGLAFGLIGATGLAVFFLGRSLNLLYESARTANRDKSELLAVVSHDLRNPICAALLCTERALKKAAAAEGDHDIVPLLQSVRGALVDSTSLISGLLDRGQMEDGKFSVEPLQGSVESLIAESLSILRPIAHARSVQLIVSVPPTLQVICDRDRIKQAIGNVIGNAIKFSPKDGRIEITVIEKAGEVLVSVKDQGPGIPEKDRASIFEKYWQAKGARKSGIGLGLGIARSFIDAHGGRIWIEGPVELGAQFWFSLPLSGTPAKGRAASRRLALYKGTSPLLQSPASTLG